MSFIWAPMLLLLSAIPLAIALYVVRESARQRRVEAYGLPVAAGDAVSGGPSRLRRRIPGAFILVGLTILVVALARPQSVVSVPRIEGTVILSFDVSGSMAATDLQPTRMEAAQAAARAFVARQPPTVRIGVVAFSDGGFSVQVPSNDPTLVLAAINRLAPERGTSIGRGIMTSLTTIATADADPAAGYYTKRSPSPTSVPAPVPIGTYASAAIILLSDGENNQQPDPLAAATAASEAGVRIYTVGIGSSAGSTIEVQGFKVHSQLDERLLRQISDITHGGYYSAASSDELKAIYDSIDTRLVIRSETMEVTSLFAGAGVLVLLVGGMSSLLWLGRFP
jgi:Ca-activated chloride channel family protein